MKLLGNLTLLRIFIILVFLNTLILLGSQYYVYIKHWDLYWLSSFFYRELLLCVSYFLLFWFLSLLPLRFSHFIAWVIFTLSIVCFVIDVFLLYNFDTNLNSYLVIVALETNLQESTEFLHNYISLGLCGVYFCLLFFCGLLWRLIKPIQVTPARFKSILISLIVGIGILITMIFTHTKPLNEDWSDMLYNYTRQIYRAFIKTYAFIQEYKTLNTTFDSLSLGLHIKQAKNDIDNIVLVIGESTQRNRLNIYGYPLPTTPFLRQFKDEKPRNFLIFNNVISPHAQTHESLSLALTFANQDSQGIATLGDKKSQNLAQKPWHEYINIIDAFKLGGYETLSISNQEPVSVFGNAVASILKRADRAEFVNVDDKMSTAKFDEGILKILDDFLQNRDKNSPLFYSLHLMGNHAKYYNRYPLEFARFTKQDMLCSTLESPLDNAMIEENMHYDNSIVYGDFILNEIIRRFEKSDSLVLFFSDHGEEIYDFRDFIGHSDSKISRFMVEIPFVIYVSDIFIKKHPALYKRIRKARNQRYMNDDLMHTLLDIAGIAFKGYEPKRSIFSLDKSLLNKRMRKVGDKSNVRDYDKELKFQKSYFEQGLCGAKENK